MSIEARFQKRLGKNFLLDVEFSAGSEIFALLGASGCGKSMALKCIAGIETPDTGFIKVDGQMVFDAGKKINLPPQKRQVGYLFQQYALFPNMTVAQNIAIGIRERASAAAVVAEQVERFHLQGLEQRYPRQLSGGQQQRVALARILASRPRVLLLDEPFSALDDHLRWQLELELKERLAEFGGTTAFVSHSRDEVYRLCDTACVMRDGKTEDKQTVADLFERPETKTACLLSGCKNFSAIRRLDPSHVEALDWGVTLQAEGKSADFVAIRAHYLQVADGPGENTLPCTVAQVVENLFSTVVMLNTPGGETGWSQLRLELPKENWEKVSGREPLYIRLPREALMLLTD